MTYCVSPFFVTHSHVFCSFGKKLEVGFALVVDRVAGGWAARHPYVAGITGSDWISLEMMSGPNSLSHTSVGDAQKQERQTFSGLR